MYTQEVTIHSEVGLQARPATFFIRKANEFKSGIWVEKDERRVNAKSLLGVLSLGIVKGTTITLIADGSDEKENEHNCPYPSAFYPVFVHLPSYLSVFLLLRRSWMNVKTMMIMNMITPLAAAIVYLFAP